MIKIKVFIPVDNKNGITFNSRRQSQDCNLRKYILTIIKNNYLMMNRYSFNQFKDDDIKNIIVDDNFLCNAKNEFCFVENQCLIPYFSKIDTLYLCKWNRYYPSDMKLDIDLSIWRLKETINIVGNSHKKITIEEWIKL